MQVERLDKGMLAIDPVSPVKHARLMPQVFPELREAAAVDMGAAVATMPTLIGMRQAPVLDRDDKDYNNYKYFLKKRSY